MRRISIISILAVAALSVSGCDFIRSVAGRPTSEELKVLSEQINVTSQTVEDTVSVVEAAPDTIAASDTVAAPLMVKCWGSSIANALPARYIVMVGIFSLKSNAIVQANTVSASGVESYIVEFTNGRTGVGVCPSDDFRTISDALPTLRSAKFFPKDAFIIDTAR